MLIQSYIRERIKYAGEILERVSKRASSKVDILLSTCEQKRGEEHLLYH